MEWLVTFRNDVSNDVATNVLTTLVCEIAPNASFVPLGENERVISVEGPRDLPEKAKAHSEIVKVYPSSTMRPYSSDASSAKRER